MNDARHHAQKTDWRDPCPEGYACRRHDKRRVRRNRRAWERVTMAEWLWALGVVHVCSPPDPPRSQSA